MENGQNVNNTCSETNYNMEHYNNNVSSNNSDCYVQTINIDAEANDRNNNSSNVSRKVSNSNST